MISLDYTLIIVILNFVFLLIILNHLLYKPLKKFLTERQKTISTDLEQADNLQKEAESLIEKQNQEYRKTSQEIRKMKEKAKKEAESLSNDIIKDAREREKDLLLDTEKQLSQEKMKAIKELELKLGDKVSLLTAKIIGRNIDQEIDAELISKLLKE